MLCHQETANFDQAELIAATILRNTLKNKAKQIRERRFRLSKQPQINYMPLQCPQAKSKLENFNSMMQRVTFSIKEDVLRKNLDKRASCIKTPLFGSSFMVEKLKTNKDKDMDMEMYRKAHRILNKTETANKFASHLFYTNNRRGGSDKVLSYSNKKQSNQLTKAKRKAGNSNQSAKICRGSSFSRNKNNFPNLSEAHFQEALVNWEDPHFIPMGNNAPSNENLNQRAKQSSHHSHSQKNSHRKIDFSECEDEPLKHIYDEIFQSSRKSRYNKKSDQNRTSKKFYASRSDANHLHEQNLWKRRVKTQEKVRVKVETKEKTVFHASERNTDELGPWV